MEQVKRSVNLFLDTFDDDSGATSGTAGTNPASKSSTQQYCYVYQPLSTNSTDPNSGQNDELTQMPCKPADCSSSSQQSKAKPAVRVPHRLLRRVGAEFFGTMILVATVVGSGIMGTELSGNLAVTLLINAIATVAVLGALIWAFGPISGAHFNPVVSGVMLFQREMRIGESVAYMFAQMAGACTGTILSNLMFDLPAVVICAKIRTGNNIWLGEIVATAGLLWIIGALGRTERGDLGPVLVPAWVCAGIFFTSSTSFANPAVTIGRSLTNTFSCIAPASVPMFVVAQTVGAAIGVLLTVFFYSRDEAPVVSSGQDVSVESSSAAQTAEMVSV
jgi:glycerol uptake facilitator-like aquaporin